MAQAGHLLSGWLNPIPFWLSQSFQTSPLASPPIGALLQYRPIGCLSQIPSHSNFSSCAQNHTKIGKILFPWFFCLFAASLNRKCEITYKNRMCFSNYLSTFYKPFSGRTPISQSPETQILYRSTVTVFRIWKLKRTFALLQNQKCLLWTPSDKNKYTHFCL